MGDIFGSRMLGRVVEGVGVRLGDVMWIGISVADVSIYVGDLYSGFNLLAWMTMALLNQRIPNLQ